MPRPRPAEAPPRPLPEPTACERGLADEAVIDRLPPLIGPGACGAPDVVRLDAVLMPNHSRVALLPAPTLRCSMAEAIADWVRTDLGPLAGSLGAPLADIENYDSYDCRGMNRIVGAKLSEHGKANALDIRSVKLVDGRVFRPTEPTVSHDFRERMKASACARFMTVLGPGSDGYHEEHIHVDLAERSNNYRICHWEVRDPPPPVPLPRPRPVIAQDGAKDGAKDAPADAPTQVPADAEKP
ncbi:MAG TPA: extensin family protein [Xanthobacteraceae bacterium]|nr:extensin family protein [Xanthobacteraceae bacterium]